MLQMLNRGQAPMALPNQSHVGPPPQATLPEPARRPDVIVPIRSLGENHRARICAHLKALNANDRYFRFGFPASDAQIERYTDSLNFERDEIFGIYNRRLQLIATAHLAYSSEDRANAASEFGVSVLAPARGRGFGKRLFERAMMHARNEGVHTMFLHVLSENTIMLNIARKAGAKVVRDGSESEAHLQLPPSTVNSQITEMVEEHLALANYQIKVQAHQFRSWLDRLEAGWRKND
jgi:GNAT superfamily N-acetyltransferase